MTVSGMEPATFRSASVNYTTAYPHSFYITSLLLQYLSFCHQGQTQNFHILEVTGDLYNAMSSGQMGESSTDYCLGTRYTGCNRRNVRDFGRAFLMLNYTDITQNTYIQSWTVTEIMSGEFWNFDSCYSLIEYQIHIETGRNMWFL